MKPGLRGKGSNQYLTRPGQTRYQPRRGFVAVMHAAHGDDTTDDLDPPTPLPDGSGTVPVDPPGLLPRCDRCNKPADSDHQCRPDTELISDPDTPPATLAAIWSGSTHERSHRQHLPEFAANPNTPPGVLHDIYETAVTQAEQEDNGPTYGFRQHRDPLNSWHERFVMSCLAANPNCSPGTVAAGRERNEVLWMRHPSTTVEQWEDLYRRCGGSDGWLQDDPDNDNKLAQLVNHPNMPSHLLGDLARHRPDFVKRCVTNPNCPTWLLEQELGSDDPDRRATVAASPAATDALLGVAVRDRNKTVRAAAARNPHLTDPELLRRLTEDRTKDVKFALPYNPNCPPEGLTAACQWFDTIHGNTHGSGYGASSDRAEDDRRSKLLHTVVTHPNLDEGTIHQILDGTGRTYDKTVGPVLLSTRRHRFPDSVRQRIVDQDDLEGWARKSYASNPSTPVEDLTVLASDPNINVIVAVASNPTADHPTIAARLAANPACRELGYWARPVTEFLESHNTTMAPAVEQCPRCGQFVGDTVHRCPDRSTRPAKTLHRNDRYLLALQNTTPPDELAELLTDPVPEVVTAAVTNPNVDQRAVMSVLTQNRTGGTLTVPQLTAAASNPNASTDVLQALTAYPEEDVRLCVARHRNTSQQTLNQMHATGSGQVRDVITHRPDCRHLTAFDNNAEYRWRHFHQISTSDRPFTVTVSASAVRKALERLTAGVDSKTVASRTVAVEVGDGMMRLSRSDNETAAMTICVPVEHQGAGEVLVSNTALKDLLKGAGRGTVTWERTPDGFGDRTRPYLDLDTARLIPVVERHEAPGGPGHQFPSHGFGADIQTLVNQIGSEHRSLVIVARPDGRRRIVTETGWAVMAYTSDPDPGTVVSTPVGGQMPTRFEDVLHAFPDGCTVELRSRDVLLYDDNTTVTLSRTQTGSPPTKDSDMVDRWDRSRHIPVGVNIDDLREGWNDIYEMEQIGASFVDARVPPQQSTTLRLSQIGPDGFVLSADEYEHTNPYTVGTPDPDGPTVTHRAAQFWEAMTAVPHRDTSLWLRDGYPTEIDLGDGYSRIVTR